MKQKEQTFSKLIEKEVALNYLLHLPPNYNINSSEKFPLIFFLHGMGERGNNIQLVKKEGIPKIIEDLDEFPFVVVSPQCPLAFEWFMILDSLHALLKEIIESYNIDTARIYLTGLSMGGYGSWHLAEAYPDIFAAIVPICAGTMPNVGFPERIKVLKNVPTWVFHGEADDVVPIENSEKLVEVLRNNNGNVKFTSYPEVGHDSWTLTYNNTELYDWLLEQKNMNFNI